MGYRRSRDAVELGNITYSGVCLNGRDIACLAVQPHHLLSDEILFKLMSLTIKLLLPDNGVCITVCLFLGEKGEYSLSLSNGGSPT